MSIRFTKIDVTSNSPIETYVAQKFIHATIDPELVQKYGLPNDYELTKWCVPKRFEHIADRVYNFKVREDDIWCVGFPKTGTTWMHNILWQLKNNLQFSTTIGHTYNVLEAPMYYVTIENEQIDKHFDDINEMPSPRIFKSHLPVYLLPKELWTVRPKIAYTSRNPKDAAVSLYHFKKSMDPNYFNKDNFFKSYLNEWMTVSPFHDHVLSFWNMRHLDHVLFSVYEDLLADQFKGVKRISDFLECSFSDQELRDLVHNASFEKVKENISVISLTGNKVDNSKYRYSSFIMN